jgi:hypothetical protein
MSQEEWPTFWEALVSVILILKKYMNMWVILNGYRGRVLGIYSILNGKEAKPSIYFNILKTKRRLLYVKTQFVPRSKHFSSRL